MLTGAIRHLNSKLLRNATKETLLIEFQKAAKDSLSLEIVAELVRRNQQTTRHKIHANYTVTYF